MQKRSGVSVVIAATGINLAIGVLYAWSVFKSAIIAEIEKGGSFQWSLESVNDPFSVCLLTFAFATVLAGRIQDRFSPGITALTGGVLVSSGFILCSFTTSYLGWVFGFGLLGGAGIAFGYSAATPPALKWFSSSRTGLIAGIVVSGFGLAPVYIAPLANWLLTDYGLQRAMFILGISFVCIVSLLSFYLINPPAGYRPERSLSQESGGGESGFGPMEMMRTKSFWVLSFCYFFGAGAGLMIIGFATELAKQSLGEWAFVLVAILAIGNAAGRVIAGMISDKIGRRRTMFSILLFQAFLMFAGVILVKMHSAAYLMVLLATLIGFNYGTNASLFPSFIKDFYGMRCFGINNGIMLTSWGVGGFLLTRISQMLNVATGDYTSSFILAGTVLLLSAALTFALKKRESLSLSR